MTRGRRRGAHWTAALIAATIGTGAAVAGCSGGPEPDPTPTPSPTASATPTPTETASPTPTPSPTATALSDEDVLAALPENAHFESFPGSYAFSIYFLEEYQELAAETPQLFDALSAPGCEFCANVRAHHEEVAEDGGTLSGGSVLVVDDVPQGGLQEDGTWGITLDVESQDLVEFDSTGAEVERVAGTTGRLSLLLKFDGHWTVVKLGAEQS